MNTSPAVSTPHHGGKKKLLPRAARLASSPASGSSAASAHGTQLPGVEELFHHTEDFNDLPGEEVSAQIKNKITRSFLQAFFTFSDTPAALKTDCVEAGKVYWFYNSLVPLRFRQRRQDFGKCRVNLIMEQVKGSEKMEVEGGAAGAAGAAAGTPGADGAVVGVHPPLGSKEDVTLGQQQTQTPPPHELGLLPTKHARRVLESQKGGAKIFWGMTGPYIPPVNPLEFEDLKRFSGGMIGDLTHPQAMFELAYEEARKAHLLGEASPHSSLSISTPSLASGANLLSGLGGPDRKRKRDRLSYSGLGDLGHDTSVRYNIITIPSLSKVLYQFELVGVEAPRFTISKVNRHWKLEARRNVLPADMDVRIMQEELWRGELTLEGQLPPEVDVAQTPTKLYSNGLLTITLFTFSENGDAEQEAREDPLQQHHHHPAPVEQEVEVDVEEIVERG
ncbi:hypothetical protein QOT17_018709 [Balamuthia mandrillaris]